MDKGRRGPPGRARASASGSRDGDVPEVAGQGPTPAHRPAKPPPTERRARIRVVDVDDHPMLRVGIRSAIHGSDDIDVVGEAGDGAEAVAVVGECQPDVVLMDVTLPRLSGTEATRQIRAARPACHVVALSMHQDAETVFAMVDAGACGFLDKSSPPDNVLDGIRIAHKGGAPFSALALEAIRQRNVADLAVARADLDALSPRLREVLRLVVEGFTTKEIASSLCLSPRTVETHRRTLRAHLGARTGAELRQRAAQLDLSLHGTALVLARPRTAQIPESPSSEPACPPRRPETRRSKP